MDTSWMERTRLLVGEQGLEKLNNAHVLIVGLGGVGSYAAEAIGRSGVGKMTILDGDSVDPTNRNRQLQALSSTHGMNKAHLMAERLKLINPDVQLEVIDEFKNPDGMQELLSQKFSYVIDAIDSISPKLYLLQTAYYNNQRIISSMGAGGKNGSDKNKSRRYFADEYMSHGPIRAQTPPLHEHLQRHQIGFQYRTAGAFIDYADRWQ